MAHAAKVSKLSGQFVSLSTRSRLDVIRSAISAAVSSDEARENKGLRRKARPKPSMPKVQFLEKEILEVDEIISVRKQTF